MITLIASLVVVGAALGWLLNDARPRALLVVALVGGLVAFGVAAYDGVNLAGAFDEYQRTTAGNAFAALFQPSIGEGLVMTAVGGAIAVIASGAGLRQVRSSAVVRGASADSAREDDFDLPADLVGRRKPPPPLVTSLEEQGIVCPSCRRMNTVATSERQPGSVIDCAFCPGKILLVAKSD